MLPFVHDLTRRGAPFLIVVVLQALLCSCMVGPNYSTPRSDVESQWVGSMGVGSTTVSGKPQSASDALWWKSFHDPVLNRLIEMAYQNNPTLQMAGVKILRARAELNESIGNLFPQQQGISGGRSYYYLPPQGNGGNSLSQFQPGTPLGQALSQALGSNLNSGGSQIGPNLFFNQLLFSSSWEIDFWGKYRRQIQSDKADFLSSVAAYDNALVSLIGDVANSYVNIRTTQDQIRVNQENVTVQKQTLDIAETRFQAGQTSELDVDQAKTELAQTEAKIPGLENTLQQSKNGLAVQLGIPPNAVEPLLKSGTLPKPPEKIIAGIPLDLLRRRPDVRQAGLEAASQSAKIGVQIANLLPAFSLSGTFGYSSDNIGNNSLANIFNWQNSILQSAGSFTMPIFNYGRLINKVRVQDANFQAAVLNYQNTVLTAQKDVENGLSGFLYSKQSVLFLSSAVTSAKATTDLAIERYKSGQTDYTTVLNAEQQQLSVENSLAGTEGDVMLGLVQVYRSLGGGWQIRNGGDVISDTVKRNMQKTTPWGRLLRPPDHLPLLSPEEEPVELPKSRLWGQPSLGNLININK
jgi:NodT family efflux transporter outer membrane factor (OMF) lipoprotein